MNTYLFFHIVLCSVRRLHTKQLHNFTIATIKNRLPWRDTHHRRYTNSKIVLSEYMKNCDWNKSKLRILKRVLLYLWNQIYPQWIRRNIISRTAKKDVTSSLRSVRSYVSQARIASFCIWNENTISMFWFLLKQWILNRSLCNARSFALRSFSEMADLVWEVIIFMLMQFWMRLRLTALRLKARTQSWDAFSHVVICILHLTFEIIWIYFSSYNHIFKYLYT